ncbi:hypothetical protein FGE12_00395 [Aggregicoccus sp. 17bor-14]|uniref:hypothetical protein n=1 Tax=Myxococcaceae TaxID=31 RepID=UPI00129CAB8B|nr:MULTISPECIES: hypothetical protein [Myxococcaceae]MBF5040833.1 hypothetical protein [Simulacricoccus sp. 17bor-14]MRI86622.1 hypothetical protein [Aggregicoccus sp. 17bor-14]
MSALTRLLLACTLLACGQSLPDPRILSVQPSQVAADEQATLVLRVDAVAPFEVDYNERTLAADSSATLWLGSVEIGPLERAPGGLLVGQLPAGLTQGEQDVRVVLADSRSATAPRALTIGPPRATVGFTFDPVAEQVRGQPFTVTLRAQGPSAASFNGVVLLFDGEGAPLTPPVTQAFVNGECTLQVTVDRVGPSMILGARDAAGRVGYSNPFRVRPN